MTTENLYQHPHHSALVSIIWSIANGLRGTYRPPQYRRVMLPLIVLARFDAILSKHADAMKALFDENQEEDRIVKLPQVLLDKKLTEIVGKDRKQTLYNVQRFQPCPPVARPRSYPREFNPIHQRLFFQSQRYF